MLCPFRQNIFVCGGGVSAPVLDSGARGLCRAPCHRSVAVVAPRQCLPVKETGQLDGDCNGKS